MKQLLILTMLFISLRAIGQNSLRIDTNYNIKTVEYLTYKNNKLINHVVYDEDGKLFYQSPLLPAQKIPRVHFASGRTYYDTKLGDTLVVEENIPPMNFHVSCSSCTYVMLTPYTYEIKALLPYRKTQKGRFIFNVYENAFTNSKLVVNKEIFFPLR